LTKDLTNYKEHFTSENKDEFFGNAAFILLSIRDNLISDWNGICEMFKINPNISDIKNVQLEQQLKYLKEAGFIEFKGKKNKIIGQITLSEQWKKIQGALGIDLPKLVFMKSENSIVIQPIYGSPKKTGKFFDIFVLMPFAKQYTSIYNDHLKKVSEELKLSIGRADDIFSTDSIMLDIWSGIMNAKLIIADCTEKNPNVFYEIGISHTVGKKVIIITQDVNDLPFDLRHIRTIIYNTSQEGFNYLERQLKSTITGVTPEPASIEELPEILVYLSYSTQDALPFNIDEIAQGLTQKSSKIKVTYWQQHMAINIIKYISENIEKCDVFLLICSDNSLKSTSVEKEWVAADMIDKPIIPVFFNPDHIPPLLKSRLGIEFDTSSLQKTIDNIYSLILRKINLAQ